MARTTAAEKTQSAARPEIVREAKRLQESLLYSSKGHFRAAAVWSHTHLIVGLPLVILSAVAGTALIKELPRNNWWALWIPVAVAVLSAILTFLNPSEKSGSHLKAGNEYDALMDRTRRFWAIDCLGDEPDLVLAKRLDDISLEKAKLNKSCPQIPPWAYYLAKLGIKKGEGEFAVDQAPPAKPK